MPGLAGWTGKGSVVAYGLAGIDDLLNLALEADGELCRVIQLKEVLTQRLVKRFLPEGEQRAIGVGEAAFQVEDVGEIGRVGKGGIEDVPLLA